MSREHFDNLLARTGTLIGLDLVSNAEGICLLRVDGHLDITIEHDETAQALILSAACATLPEDPPVSLLAEILTANYYWIGAGGATLALHGRSRTLYLQFREPLLHLEAARLKDLLEALVVNAETWHARLSEAAAEPANPSPKEPAQPPLTMHEIRV